MSWKDEWRDIPGYGDSYEMSTSGNVRRKDGYGSDGRRVTAHYVVPTYDCNRHFKMVALWKDGNRKGFLLHKLYALTFGVSEKDAMRRVYHGFHGDPDAYANTYSILHRCMVSLKKEEKEGKDRHDEILFLDQFMDELIEMETDALGDSILQPDE